MPSSIGVFIPTRLNSRRLPRKALADINGKPLIHHVYLNAHRAAAECGLSVDIKVCTDSEEIIAYLATYNIPYLRTSSRPSNGTEPISEAYNSHNLCYDYILDLQGDEPFVNHEILSVVIKNLFRLSPHDPTIILPHQLISAEQATSKSIVKLVTAPAGNVMYMSRAVIPSHHKAPAPLSYKKHLSLIGFTKAALAAYYSIRPQSCESCEDIELLRALEHNIKIISPFSTSETFSIDTPHDLEEAREILF